MVKRKTDDLDLSDDDSQQQQHEQQPNDDKEGESIRNCLKMIRSLDTMPSDILPNGKSASETAHDYVLQGKIKRIDYKKKQDEGGSPVSHKKKKRKERK